MHFVLRTIATAVAVGIAAFIVPGIVVTGSTSTARLLTLLVVAVVVGLVNTWIKPLVTGLTGCLIVVTFGLFLLVINAALLMASAWLAQQLGFGFYVNGWWAAVLGSIIVSIVSGLLNGILGVPAKADDRA